MHLNAHLHTVCINGSKYQTLFLAKIVESVWAVSDQGHEDQSQTILDKGLSSIFFITPPFQLLCNRIFQFQPARQVVYFPTS